MISYSHLSLSSQTRFKMATFHGKHTSVNCDHVLILLDTSCLIGQLLRECACESWPAITHRRLPIIPFSDSKHWQASHRLAIRPGVWSVAWLLTHPDFSQGSDPWWLGRWTWGMWKRSEVKSSSAGSPPSSNKLNLSSCPAMDGATSRLAHPLWAWRFRMGAVASHVGLKSNFEGPCHSHVLSPGEVKLPVMPPSDRMRAKLHFYLTLIFTDARHTVQEPKFQSGSRD